ncbi:MAG: hypothetical protein IPQ26_07710 [Elusimicrobia bacterium]|nr:hypothetical protein [Elusimicrobiota bacterium]
MVGGEYDGDKNLLKYDELTRSRGLDTHVTWEATDYEVNERWDARKEAGETDSWGRSSHHLTGYKKTTTGPDGKVELDVFTNLGYDEFENMIHYDREATDFQGKVMNVVWDGEYDKFDRAAAYKQTTTDAFGHTQVLEFSGGEYNVYDDLLAYTEKTTENGETKSRVFTNGVFDTKHNMMSYREEATDSKGRTSIKEWNAVGAGKGYVLGELQGYDEVVNYGALVVTSEVRNIHYDALRRQDGNATTKRIKGVETDGGAVDIVLVEDTRVMRSDEARSVRAVGSTDPRSMNIVNVVGGRTEVRTRGTDGVTGELLRDLKETVERSQVTVAGDFKEVRRTEGKDGEDELDSVAETIRTGTVLDGFGRAVTYREETVQNNNPASWMSRVVDRMSYNVDGNLTASHEATLNSLGVVGEVTRTGMLYDQQNRLSEYHMEQVSSAEGATVGSQTHRTGIKYNGLSDVTRYGERVERLGTAVVETGMWSGTYNVLGQVKTSRDETRRGGAVVEEGVTKALDETVLTETWGMRYTKDGVGVRQYKERTGSSATPDLVNFLEVTGATYDAYNRLATFNQTSHRVTAEAAAVVNGAFVFDEGKATLHEVTVTGRTEAVFDGKGALTGYKERTETRDGTGVAGGWTETVRHDIKFHPLGQMVAYEAEERKAESPDLMTAVEWSGSVDAFNRSAGYVEIRQDHHGNGTLGPRSVEARTGLVYNGLAQVEAYERTRRSSDAPDVVTTVTVENATYDTFGNQTGYRETTRTRGAGSRTRVWWSGAGRRTTGRGCCGRTWRRCRTRRRRN